jgi:pimeloyl-ACP methyl ester carboxylesterase
VSIKLVKIAKVKKLRKEKISFEGWQGTKISAELDSPDGEINYYAIYIPCFTCTINYRSVKYITKAMNENGVAVLKFDFPGLGNSVGDFSESNFSTNLENIRLAYKYLQENYETPRLLIGHSLGGAAVMRLCMELGEVKAVCAIAAPDAPSHLAGKLISIEQKIDEGESGDVMIDNKIYTLKKHFFDDLRINDGLHKLNQINKPVLVMYSPDDTVISKEHTIKNFTDVRGHKSFVTLNNVGHLMNKESDASAIGNIIASWAGSYCFDC